MPLNHICGENLLFLVTILTKEFTRIVDLEPLHNCDPDVWVTAMTPAAALVRGSLHEVGPENTTPRRGSRDLS